MSSIGNSLKPDSRLLMITDQLVDSLSHNPLGKTQMNHLKEEQFEKKTLLEKK